MACNLSSITSSQITNATNNVFQEGRLRRSFSSKDLCQRTGMRRSYSENQLCCYKSRMTEPKLKNSRSMSFFNIPLSDTLRSFLFDPETERERNVEQKFIEAGNDEEMDVEKKRVNWVEKLLEIRNNWKDKQLKVERNVDQENERDCYEDGGCETDYGDDEVDEDIDRDTFSALLKHVSWSDTKLFSQLAFLSNRAYVIPDIKSRDLRRYCGLEFVTSSLEKKAETAAIRAKIEQDFTSAPVATPAITGPLSGKKENSEQRRYTRSSAAYEIAVAAASYLQSRAKDLISSGFEPQLTVDVSLGGRDEYQVRDEESVIQQHKSEMAACVAASTMTAVVAGDEKQKQEAARDLQSFHSSPCEWFVCDDSKIYTRCFVIQGSDTLASWQANLFFEPTKFEGTDVPVHRGIYEAAKGIYEQFMPEIMQHLNKFGERAKLQFTGHSLGGSLALLVNLILLTRKVVKPSALLPVVTFGSPFVFCNGQKVLDKLGLDENHVYSVMMHRDIVPRAFSCTYPDYAAQVLKRLNGTFRSHPCLKKNKLLYSPVGKIFILQPDEKSSPPHPLLPPGSALYALENTDCTLTKRALRAFLNSPHPLETLSDPKAYGSDGTIIRDHESSNYLKAVNDVIRQHTRLVVKKAREQRNQLWPLLTSHSPHAWVHKPSFEDRLVAKKIMTGV
ncbi:uncharacterized protein LOC111381087 isoform X2 [Olea europaea var. sylvestris]|uniref:Uncharacterized protein LOC111381087 isoform X2 n=1 Tax=Olea europaea subsp. europaea TaxID=158383 RepID=A0A8S0QT56_OLEEU|nr:uncharacterized protein LOC111381087 isoform X2 [Olea europaea var. sylvestris]CAA2968651.1 uncharacterized protein LOC111381087 isoform X2 [Olea europaea subsp. europaea]